MSNLVPQEIPTTLPAHLNRPELMALNTALSAGLPLGGFPLLGLKGTRFVVKNEGVEQVLPQTQIAIIILAAKPNLDKNWYASKYDPNSSEAKAPDCFSRDGIKPDPSSVLKQNDICASCPQNQFGSGTDASGNAAKGKACSDSKMLAVFANNGVYGMRVPPASLKALGGYAKLLSSRGVPASACITLVGFDPNFTYPVLTFDFGGFLTAEQAAVIIQKQQSDEVARIIEVNSTPVQNPPALVTAAPEPPVVETHSNPFEVITPEPAPTEKPKRGRPAAATVTPIVQPAAQAADPSEADLAAALGITL